jgi:HTH domain
MIAAMAADHRPQLTAAALRQLEDDVTVSPARLAEYWNVHPQTVYRDIRKGALLAFRLPSGQLRIRMSDAVRYGKPIEV